MPPRPTPAPPNARPAAEAEVPRRRILHAAEETFLTRGLRSLTMDDLAAEIGMSKRTLYQHFTSKDDLFTAVIDARLASIEHDLEALTRQHSADVARQLNAVLAYLSRRLGEIRPAFLQDVRRHAPETFDKIDRFRRRMMSRYFGQLLERGRARGFLREDLSATVVMEIALTLITTIVTPESLQRLNVSPAEAFNTILSVLLEGLLTPAGRRQARTRSLPNPWIE